MGQTETGFDPPWPGPLNTPNLVDNWIRMHCTRTNYITFILLHTKNDELWRSKVSMITIRPIGYKSVDRFMDVEPKSKDRQSHDKPSDDINQAMHTKVDSSYKESKFQLQDIMLEKLQLDFSQVHLKTYRRQ